MRRLLDEEVDVDPWEAQLAVNISGSAGVGFDSPVNTNKQWFQPWSKVVKPGLKPFFLLVFTEESDTRVC